MVAQPSGGPYGPIHQTYSLPVVPGKIYYVAMDGQAGTNGETPDLPTTLTAAIERVKTGDAIVMRGGTYRTGNLLLNQGITIQAYADEQPVMKGTLEATEWQNLGNGLWVTSWTNLFPARPESWWQRLRSGKQTPLHRFNNDMVFVDGKFLQSAGWEGEVDDNTFYIDYEAGRIYIGTDPANRLVEITAFDCAIHRITHECHGKVSDKKGPVIRGITFTQYAYRAIEIDGTNPEGISPESNHGKEVTGTILEHCTISYCSRVAAYLRGDNMIIRHCRISDTSTEGIYILSSSDVLLERNIFMRNNIEMITGYYPAAVKIFNQCYRVTFLDNLVTDLPNSNGVWYDVGNVDGRFLNNWVQNVGTTGMDVTRRRPWPSDNGFFFEISKGAVCAGNVFVNCDNGIFVLNSSDVQIYQNTMVNSSVCIARDARSAVGDHFGWHPSTGPDVDKRDGHIFINNLLTGDENFHHPLLNVWQPETLCEQLDNPMLKQFDFNVYVRNSTRVSDPLIFWSPVKNTGCWISLTSLDSLRALHPEFESGGRFYSAYNGPLFISRELGNYQILKGFPGSTVASPLPPQISKLLGRTAKGKAWTGAYPPF
jgi:parallel beta-helix repeat protein